jgi:hypothetical protein
MNKLCITALTFALGAPALAHARDDRTPPLADTDTGKAAASASVTATADAKIKISDQEALDDDILAVINLPIAAADAREAGVEEVEIKEALDTTRDVGLSAGDASEIVAEEADQTRTRGVKKGFGRWVRMQVAAGLRGKKLAAKIKERKKDTAELDEKAETDLRAKLEKQRELNTQWRAKAREKQAELLAKGKARVLTHKERNEKLSAKLDAAQAKNAENGDALTGRLKALDAKIAAADDADKPMLEAEKKRLEAAAKKNDKVGDKLEKAEDKLDKKEDKLEKLTDKAAKRDEKRDAKADAKADAKPKDKAAPGTPAQ